MCKSGLSEKSKVQNSMHRMLFVFLIQRNICMCMKFFWKGGRKVRVGRRHSATG